MTKNKTRLWKRLLSAFLSTAVIAGTIPAFPAAAERPITSGAADKGSDIPQTTPTDPELGDDVLVLPAELPEDLREAYTNDGSGCAYLVMGSGQASVDERGKYAITIYRLGDISQETVFTVGTVDYSAKYGRDYRIADSRFITETFDVPQTLVELSADEENIKQTEKDAKKFLESEQASDDAAGAGEPAASVAENDAPAEPFSDTSSDKDDKKADPEKSLAELKHEQTGLPTRETTEDEAGDALLGFSELFADEGPVNIGDYLDNSSLTYMSFAPGEKVKRLVFEVLEDGESEGQEVIEFVLGETVEGVMNLEPNIATVVIEDDEPAEHSAVSFSTAEYKADGNKATITLERKDALYTFAMLTLYIKDLSGNNDSVLKEVTFNPFRKKVDIELSFNLGTQDREFELTLQELKGIDEGKITKASLIVPAVPDSFRSAIPEDVESDGGGGIKYAEDGDKINIGGHDYILSKDPTQTGVFMIMTKPNDTVLNRKAPVQVGVYYSAESGLIRNARTYAWGDSATKDIEKRAYDPETRSFHLKWYSRLAWEKGSLGLYFELPMRPYSSIFLDYTALSRFDSSKTKFWINGAHNNTASNGVNKELFTYNLNNLSKDKVELDIDKRTLMGPLRMTQTSYFDKYGTTVGYSDTGKVPDQGSNTTTFIINVGKDEFGCLEPEDHIYGVACMFQRFSFTIDEPSKMTFRTAEGNTVSEFPARVDLADKITRIYGETISIRNEQNDIDIKVPKGRLVGWEISPQGGTKFTVTTKDARDGKISYLSRDGLTFTLNDDLIDALTKNGIEIRSGDMDDAGYIMPVSMKPLFEYITTTVEVLPSEGGKFADAKLSSPGTYTFNVGDTLNLAGVPDEGYYYAGYSLKEYTNTDDTGVKSDGKLYLSPTAKKLSNCERYVLCPVFTKEDNRIEIIADENAAKYFELQGLCSDAELTESYLKGKNILKIVNKQSADDPAYRPVVGDAYEIAAINTAANDGTWRPVFTIEKTGQKINGYVADIIAEKYPADNVILVSAEKTDPSEYSYFELKSSAVYSSAKLRNANGEKTIDPAANIAVKAGGRAKPAYDASGSRIQLVTRASAFTGADGSFAITGIEAIPGDIISVTFDNEDRQQVKYVTVPGGLPASKRSFEELVPNDATKEMEVVVRKDVDTYVFSTEPMGMPVISPRSPEVAKLYYSYEADSMRDTTLNTLELRPEEQIMVYADILPKGTKIRSVHFILYNKNGNEKEEAEGGTQTVALPLAEGDGHTYMATFKAVDKLQAGDTLYVQIESDDKKVVTINGKTENIYKKYPRLNTGLAFCNVVAAAETQFFRIEPNAGDYLKDMPFIGKIGDGMLANSGGLALKKEYLDPRHPDTSPFYLAIGVSGSVASAIKNKKKLDEITNGKHEAAKAAEAEKYTVKERVAGMDPVQEANATEQQALRDKLAGVNDPNERTRLENDWKNGVRDRLYKDAKKEQTADSFAKMNSEEESAKKGPNWDVKFMVLLQLEYAFIPSKNDWFFIGGQYMFGGIYSYKRVWHRMVGFVPMYFSLEVQGGIKFDGRFMTETGMQSYTEAKKQKNIGDYYRTAWPWMTISANGKFYIGVGFYGIVGARGGVDICFTARFSTTGSAPKGPAGGILLSLKGGFAVDLLITSLKYDLGELPIARTGVYDPETVDKYKKTGISAKASGIPDVGYVIDNFELDGKEISYLGRASSENDPLLAESDALGIEAPANIEQQMILVDNASEYIRPQIVNGANGTRFMTYLSKRDGRSVLCYSVDTGSGFSKETPVDPEGSLMDSTNALLAKDGKIYIAWTSASISPDAQTEASLEKTKEALQSMNLKLAVYDIASGTLSAPTDVTDDHFMNTNVRLFAEGGNVVMYYFKKDIGSAETVDDLTSLKSNYSTWARATYDTAANKLTERDTYVYVMHPTITDPILLDYSSAVYKTTGGRSWRMSVYTVDKDINSAESDPRTVGADKVNAEVWLQITDVTNSVTYSPILMEEGNVSSTKLNVLKNDILFTWLRDSGTLKTVSAQGLFELRDDDTLCKFEHFINGDTDPDTEVPYSVDHTEMNFSPSEDEVMSLSQYQVIDGADGNAYLFATGAGREYENRGIELWGASYFYGRKSSEEDEDLTRRNGWGQLVQITHYGKNIDEIAVAVDEGHNTTVLANLYDSMEPAGGYEARNYKLVELECKPVTSLLFSSYITFSEDNYYPTPGEETELCFTLVNDGLLPAENYRIEIEQIQGGQTAQAADPYIWRSNSDTIFSGEEREFRAKVTLPQSLNDLTYKVSVTEMEKGDSSKKYNTVEETMEVVARPDLVLSYDPYFVSGSRLLETAAQLRIKAVDYSYDSVLTDEECEELLMSLSDEDLELLFDLMDYKKAATIRELIESDISDIDITCWYAVIRLINCGNADAVNVTAKVSDLTPDGKQTDVLGTAVIDKLGVANVGALIVPVKINDGKLFNELGVLTSVVDISVDGEIIYDSMTLQTYTTENLCLEEKNNNYQFNLRAGDNYKLEMTAYPFDEQKDLMYLSVDPDVAVISENGVITGLSEGDTEIWIFDVSGSDFPRYKVISVEVTKRSVVQTLPGNRLTFDAVNDGDILTLLKGGVYTVEDGLEVVPAVKNAVNVNAKNHRLTVSKSSVLTIKKGNVAKTITMEAVTVRKAAAAFTSRKKTITLDELFTGAGQLIPDVQNGKYRVDITDKNGIMTLTGEPDPSEPGVKSLSEFVLTSNGKSGSATVTVWFGGKKFAASVKCAGYPVLEGANDDNIVNSLPENVLTFDAVDDKDTLILSKSGKYTLEAGVGLETAVKNAVKVNAGTRVLKLSKETVLTLTKTVDGVKQTKTILLNLVNVKKKNVTLKVQEAVTLDSLFTEAYELLPDISGTKFAVEVTDAKGILETPAFPTADDVTQLTLENFRLTAKGTKGSAKVTATFGGKKYTATITIK